MVEGKLTVASALLSSVKVTVLSSFFFLSGPLRDSLSSAASPLSASSPSEWLGAFCPSWLPSPYMMSSQGSCFWQALASWLATSCVEMGTSSCLHGNTSCTHRVLWLTVFLCVPLNNLVTGSIIDVISHTTCCLQKCSSWQNHLPPWYSWWLGSLGLINGKNIA